MSTFPFGGVAGLRVRVHLSWTIILALVVVTVASQVGSVDPASALPARWAIGLAVAIGFLLSAVAHELGHAIVARRRGIRTDVVVVHFLGAAASPRLESLRPRDEIAVALAGPLVSIVLGLAFLGVAAAADAVGSGVVGVVARIALVIGTLDVALGLLNLIPAYPLDGGRVIRGIGWARAGDPRAGLRVAATAGRVIGLVFAVAGVAAMFVADSAEALMVALGGWFLISTARAIERRAGLDALLDGISVRDMMERDPSTISPGLTIDTFADQVLGGSAALALPVVQGTQLLGLIGARQLRRARRDRWATLRVEDLMIRPPSLPVLSPDASAQSAVDDLARTSLDGLPVVEDGVLTGVVLRRTVAEALRVRAKEAGITPW
jgi:Zn-dependent protease/CBS domain-containing protein